MQTAQELEEQRLHQTIAITHDILRLSDTGAISVHARELLAILYTRLGELEHRDSASTPLRRLLSDDSY